MSEIDTSGAAIQAAMADPDPVQMLRLLGALAAERDELRAECDTLQAERDALRAAKWDVKHTDTMNDMVQLGMARDEAEQRAREHLAFAAKMEADRDAARATLEDARHEMLALVHGRDAARALLESAEQAAADAEIDATAARAEVARLKDAVTETLFQFPSMRANSGPFAAQTIDALERTLNAALAGDPQP